MINKDYSVTFGATKAGKKLGLHLNSCSRTEQFQVASIWNKFTTGVKDISLTSHISAELLFLWFAKYKLYIPTANISEQSKDLLLNIITAKYRDALKEISK